MVENIYEYAQENTFSNGVFLVGSAHKSAIVELINKRPHEESVQIDWRIGF